MAEVITPAAPAATSAPAAAPAPAATPQAAPQGAPQSAPAEAQPIKREAGETSQQHIKRIIETRTKEGAETGAPAAVAAPPAEAAPAEPAKAAPAEAPKVEEKTDEQKAAEAKAAAEAEEGIQFAEDEIAPTPLALPTPKELAKELEANPELKAALDKAPQIRDKFYKAARVLAEVEPVLKLVPNERAAKFLTEQTQLFGELRDTMMNAGQAQTPEARAEGYKQFMAMVAQESFLHDDETGELLKDANGRPVSDGSIEGLADHILNVALESFERIATSSENADLAAAVKTLRDARTQSSSPTPEDLPEHLKAKAAAIEQQEKDLRLREQTTANEKRTSLENDLRAKFADEGDKAINKIVAHYDGLSDFTKAAALRDIRHAALESLTKDSGYVSQRDYLRTLPQTAETRKERLELFRGHFKQALLNVYRPVMEKATKGAVDSAEARAAKIKLQEAASRSEPKGGTAAPLPTPQPTGTDALMKFREDFKKTNNRYPSTFEMTQERVRAARAAAGR